MMKAEVLWGFGLLAFSSTMLQGDIAFVKLRNPKANVTSFSPVLLSVFSSRALMTRAGAPATTAPAATTASLSRRTPSGTMALTQL